MLNKGELLIAEHTGWSRADIRALPLHEFHNYLDLITKTED